MSKLLIVTDTPGLEAILDKNPGWGPHGYAPGHVLLQVEHDGVAAALKELTVAVVPNPASSAHRLHSKLPQAIKDHVGTPTGTVHDMLVDAFGLAEDHAY